MTDTTQPIVLCNWCGLPCNLEPEPWDRPLGLIRAEVGGGYPSTPGNGSGALDDGVGYRFSLCEFCLDHLFGKFKIPVETFDPMIPYKRRPGESLDDAMKRTNGFVSLGPAREQDPWEDATTRVLRDDWRAMKAQFFAAKAERDRNRR